MSEFELELGVEHFGRFEWEAAESPIPMAFSRAFRVLSSEGVDGGAIAMILTGRGYRETVTEYAILHGYALARVKEWHQTERQIEAITRRQNRELEESRAAFRALIVPDNQVDIIFDRARAARDTQLGDIRRNRLEVAKDCGSAILVERMLPPEAALRTRVELFDLYSDPTQQDHIVSIAREQRATS